jgi:hypothetical protein
MSDARSSVLDLIDQICDRYELAHLAGQRPRLDDYLGGVPEAERAGLLCELLRLEGAYLQTDQRRRWQQGERVRLRAYLEEVPALRQHPELLFELVCAEVLLRLECHDTPPPRPVDYLELLPGQEAQLRRFFAARHLLPAPTAQPISEQGTLRGARQRTVVAPNHTVDELPAPPGEPAVPVAAPLAPRGYVVLGELGRGGMGVVYTARQLSAGRVVALKMLLHAGQADAEQLGRFRSEAVAIARLQHPHVVQVFEVGEHGGLPFFSLEYCPGGSLDRKLAGTPLPPAEAAALVEKVARGVQAAHEAQVIHRDLKPANVLLAADGTPKVSDFGLARKLDAPAVTHSGVIMGTPSYMAPEQARGEVDRLGPAVDVYALGAVLYECLTGRPPFRAAAVMDTLLQVVSAEPVPPRQLNPKVPRDLETVCLKCLQKEPSRRYASAAELAEELGRFRRGEPVVARPVGVAERAAKWVRRSPWLATALAAVVLALLLSAAVSTYFGMDASHEAGKARDNAADAVAAGNDLETANGTLTKRTDELEGTLARGLLRPLALHGGAQPMTDTEWEALWQLATDNRGRLSYRFVKEAAQGPVTGRQLRDRAMPALTAAVGLDEERRAEVEKLLLARLEEEGVGAEQKRDLALALAALGGLSSSALGRTEREITRALREEKDAFVADLLAQGLSALAARLEPQDAAHATSTLIQAIKSGAGVINDSYYGSDKMLEALLAMAARLEAREVSTVLLQAIRDLLQPIQDTTDFKRQWTLERLTRGLAAVAARLEPKSAAEAAATLIEASKLHAFEHPIPDPAWSAPMHGLSAVAARLDPRDAGQAAAVITRAIKADMNRKAFAGQDLTEVARGLSALAARLDPEEAGRITGPAAAILIRSIHDAIQPPPTRAQAGRPFDSMSGSQLSELAKAVSALAPHLGSADAARAASTLTQALKDRKGDKSALAQALSALAARLGPKDAVRAATTVAQVLRRGETGTVTFFSKDGKSVIQYDLSELAQAESALAARMEPRDAARTARTLTQAIKGTKDPFAVAALAQAVSGVSARLGPEEASRMAWQAATALTQVIREAMHPGLAPGVLAVLAQALAALAASLDAKAAAQAVSALTQAIHDANRALAPWQSNAWTELQPAVSALAARLGPTEAAQAASALTQALMNPHKDPRALGALVDGFSVVATRLGPKEVTQVANTLVQAIQYTREPRDLATLARGLSEVAARLGPEDAGRVTGQAAAVLTRAINDARQPYALFELAMAVSALTPRLGPTDAARAASTLTHAIMDTENSYPLPALAQALSGVSARLGPEEAGRMAGQAAAALTQLIREAKHPNALAGLAQALSAVAASLDAKDAAQAASTLIQAIKDNKDPGAWSPLTQALSAISVRLEAKGAVQAATTYAQAIKETKNPFVMAALAQGLSAVAAHLEPREGARATTQAATVLAQATQDARDARALSVAAHSLSVVSAGLAPKEAASTIRQAAEILAQAIKDSDPSNKNRQWLLPDLAIALSALAARLEAEDAAQAAATLSEAIKNSMTPGVWYHPLVASLSALAVRLEPRDAAQAAAVLCQAIKDGREAAEASVLAQSLAALAVRLEPRDAAQAASILSEAIRNTKDPNAMVALAQGLSALAARLEPRDAAQAASVLAQAVKEEKFPFRLPALAQGLSAVSARLEPAEAGQIIGQTAVILTQAIKDEKDLAVLPALANALSAAVARLEAKDAAQAAATLIEVIKDKNGPNILFELAQGLSAVAARLEPKDAVQTAITLIQAIKDNKDPGTLTAWAPGLSAVAARLEAKDARPITRQAATILIEAMQKQQNLEALPSLARSLSAVASRLEPVEDRPLIRQAAANLAQAVKKGHWMWGREPARGLSVLVAGLDVNEAVATLVQAIKETSSLEALRELARELAVVAARLEPGAAPTTRQAAATLAQTIKGKDGGARNPDFILQELALALSAVAARLEAEEAAAILIQTIKDCHNPHSRRLLVACLSVALSAVPGSPIPTLSATAASAVASAAGSGQPLAALAAVLAAAEPPPCRLPTQELVELLKMPTCMSEARRVVLDQLGNRYRRSFADQWDFVRFAQKQQLGLDFTSPPRRPDRAAAAR